MLAAAHLAHHPIETSFSLIPASSVQHVRDEDHAETLLREAGCRAEGEELRRLAGQVAAGTLILARHEDDETLDALDAAPQAPLLTTLMMAVG